MYPQLRADLTSADYPGAFYENKVFVRGSSARVTNRLVNAPDLEWLMAQGKAKWSIEIRAPAALWSRTELTSLDDKTFNLSPEETGPEVFVISRLVAVEDLDLPTRKLNPAWHENDIVEIPRGVWLALGNIARTESSVSSILRFVKSDHLPSGRMEIAGPDDQFQFIVSVAPDLFARRSYRDVQIAALIGVMGRMPAVAASLGEGNEPPILRTIRARLEGEDVTAWDDRDNYDAATAATALEPFTGGQEEEEEE